MRKVGIRERVGRWLAGEPSPTTWVRSGGSEKTFFGKEERKPERMAKWKYIYEQGGLVSEAIDCYPLFVLSNGYRVEGKEGSEAAKKKVEDWLEQPNVDFEGILDVIIKDSCIYGSSFSEIIGAAGGGVWGIVSRDSTTFEILYDSLGRITGYLQTVPLATGEIKKITLKPDQVLHLALFQEGGEVYGRSLIERAYNDIERDTSIAEGIANSVKRHGFPKFHIRVGYEGKPGEPCEDVSDTDLQKIEKKFEDINTKHEFVTIPDVRIGSLDVGGIQGMDVYSTVSIQRLCTALGVPEEILGLGRGSTEATANVRLRAWYDKVGSLQKRVARVINRNIIDRITGSPGLVWIEFNDVNPEDEAKVAAMIAAILTATPLDPFMLLPKKWVLEKLGIGSEYLESEEPSMTTPPEEGSGAGEIEEAHKGSLT